MQHHGRHKRARISLPWHPAEATRRLAAGRCAEGHRPCRAADPGRPVSAAAALDLQGPLTVSELVETLGVSQPGVTQMAARLEALGLVEIRSDTSDRRTRTIALSADGRRLIARSKRDLWPRIEAAVLDACGGRKSPLLELLAKVEEELESSARRADSCEGAA